MTPNAPQLARVAIRVSFVGNRGEGSDSGREFLSPDLQLDAAKAYCQIHGLTLDIGASREHQDLDQGAFRRDWRKRPGLAAHLKAAQEGRVKHILFYKLSRMARNALDGLEIFEAFEAAGCTVHVIKEGIDTSTSVGRLLRTMLLAVAEMQGEDQSDFAKDAIRRRVASGKHHGTLPGWLRREGEEIVFFEPFASALRRLVELRLSGLSYVHIARALNQEGHTKASGALWRNDDVAEYLSADARLKLAGNSILGVGLEEGDPGRVVTPGVFPSLLDEPTSAALAELQRRHEADPARGERVRRWTNTRSASTRWLLSGLIWCPHCGGRLYSLTGGNSNSRRYYHCPQSRALADSHPGGKTYLVNAEHAEDAALLILHAGLAQTTRTPKKAAKAKKASTGPDATGIARQIDSLFELHSAGILETGDFERRYKDLLALRESLKTQEDEDGAIAALGIAKAIAGEESPTQEQLRQMILLLVDRVECPPSGEREARRAEGRTEAAARAPRRQLTLFPRSGIFDWVSAHIDLRTSAFQGEREIGFQKPPEGF